MNERLLKFLASENISQAVFADKLGIARASVSHIISGRNKPGYTFFDAIIQNYPALNIEWLISGIGDMYKEREKTLFNFDEVEATDEITNSEVEHEISKPLLFESETPNSASANQNSPQSEPKATQIFPNLNDCINTNISIDSTINRKIQKIIVFFSDNTFDEFSK